MTLNEIFDLYPEDEFLKADGFDDAVIGIEPNSMVLIYNREKMIEILMEQDLTYEDAIEYLEFNTWNAYVGKKTPLYIHI